MSTEILATIQNLENQLALLKKMLTPSVEKAVPVKKAKKSIPTDSEVPLIKEKKIMSEGVRLWNVLIAETLEQMKASGWTHPETGKPASRKDAMGVASTNKKTMPIKAEKASASEESGTESESSKKGPKKGSHWSPEAKAAAAAKRAAKKVLKASTVPLPASPPSEPEDEMVKTVISGKTYFINSRNNAAFRDGSYEGLYDGEKINTEAAEPI
jgi:hypothetical protein